LSKLYRVMIEKKLVELNPVRLLERLSEKSGERQVYVSASDFSAIVSHLPSWMVPVAWTAYYTGMRLGEVLGLKRSQVNLSRRMIVLAPEATKEKDWKRIPIHRELVPIIEGATKLKSLRYDEIFLRDGKPISRFLVRRPWVEAVARAGLRDVRFHDIRAVWATNARRSGIDYEIRQQIMGHATRLKSVSERYGRISEKELIESIDKLSFDFGHTEVLTNTG